MFKKAKQFRNYLKNSDGLKAALVPAEAVVVGAPAPEEEAAVGAAVAGDHRPAAELLDRTRRERDWDAHSRALTVMADAAQTTPQWLEDWERAEPDSPAAALLRARLGLVEAWRQRTNLRAENVTQEQFDAFHATLGDSTALIQRAADLAPDDPEPWNLALIHARGLEAPREVMEDYLGSLRALDPWHYWGHRAALEFLTEKWFGSHEEAYGFARSVAEAAPAGARVQTLELDALLEHLAAGGKEQALADRARTDAVLDRARRWISAHEADPRVRVHRNTLAVVLMVLGRGREAYDELLAIGPHVTEYPWSYWDDDARSSFLARRDAIVALAAQE